MGHSKGAVGRRALQEFCVGFICDGISHLWYVGDMLGVWTITLYALLYGTIFIFFAKCNDSEPCEFMKERPCKLAYKGLFS